MPTFRGRKGPEQGRKFALPDATDSYIKDEPDEMELENWGHRETNENKEAAPAPAEDIKAD